MLFPLKSAFPELTVQGFDFSPRAIQMCSDRAKELNVELDLALVDLSTPLEKSPFSVEADVATLIFVLSAIHPDKHAIAVKNMRNYVKDGGTVIVRDYGVNDYAMIRFKRGAKLADRFYVRQDGTRSYYFTLGKYQILCAKLNFCSFSEELAELFERAGFECVRKEYLHRQTVNHQKNLNVPRIFVQARFLKR
ncbi:unnamed protein product [Cylicostephanus goldi]|uniref:Methyltransferase domain-containing protein n=1 Tax=Cylicostephanus goldi TaxID=71465 RepID=A0A3P7NWJ3_CYLGO|nr:unnamed protein product [Cylicostephanus goldi]